MRATKSDAHWPVENNVATCTYNYNSLPVYPTTRKETLLTAILFDSHVLCDTSFILHEVCHKALKGSFTSLYMMGTLSLSVVSPQIEKRRDGLHLVLKSRRDVTPTTL
jgi:hypothetical protein